MATCSHKPFLTRDEADAALARLIALAKRTGDSGKSWKRLNVFQCGNHFHIGRANKLPKNYAKPKPSAKVLSFGELRRKLKRVGEKMDAENRHMAYLIGQQVEADRRITAAEAEMLEVQRQVTAYFLDQSCTPVFLD